MSRENVEHVRSAFEAFNRRDVDGFLQGADLDLVTDWSRAVGRSVDLSWARPGRPVRRSWWDAFDESAIIVDELIDAGDQVVAVFHGRQRGRGSGAVVEGRGSVLVWNIRDGRVVSATLYQQLGEALEAVGLA